MTTTEQAQEITRLRRYETACAAFCMGAEPTITQALRFYLKLQAMFEDDIEAIAELNERSEAGR